MAVSTKELEEALVEGGVTQEAAPNLANVLVRMFGGRAEEVESKGTEHGQINARSAWERATDQRLDRIEQEFVHLRELLTVRFDAVDHRFEQVDQRFEELQRSIDQRFEQVDQRFEELQRSIDQRFDQIQREMDQRFDQMQRETDQRHAAVEERLDRERRERWGLVTAATGAIVVGLLRIFGAI